MGDVEDAWFKLRGMSDATLRMVQHALASLVRLGWFEPDEAYTSEVTMEAWRHLVLSEVEQRAQDAGWKNNHRNERKERGA